MPTITEYIKRQKNPRHITFSDDETEIVIENRHFCPPLHLSGRGFPTIKRPGYSGCAVRFKNCSGIRVDGFQTLGGLYGVWLENCDDIIFYEVQAGMVGQECFVVRSTDGKLHRYVQWVGGKLHNSGRKNPQYGEGAYFGTGAPPRLGIVANISMAHVAFEHLTAEAVDVKPDCASSSVSNCQFNHIDLPFNGVITLRTSGQTGVRSWHKYRNLDIKNFTNRNGYRANAFAIGAGNVDIEGSRVERPSDRSKAVQLYGTFEELQNRRVRVRGNEFYGWQGAHDALKDGSNGLAEFKHGNNLYCPERIEGSTP